MGMGIGNYSPYSPPKEKVLFSVRCPQILIECPVEINSDLEWTSFFVIFFPIQIWFPEAQMNSSNLGRLLRKTSMFLFAFNGAPEGHCTNATLLSLNLSPYLRRPEY